MHNSDLPASNAQTGPTILSYTAEGVLVPYSLMDVQAALRQAGYRVLVQDIAALRGYHEKFIAIVDALACYRPDVIFTIDQIGLIPPMLAVLDKPAHIAAWFFDNPFAAINDDFLLVNSRLHFHLWDRAYLPQLHERGYARLDYRPFATNPAVFKPLPAGGAQPAYEVSFVGGASPERLNLIGYLAANGVRVDVFGDQGWRDLRDPNVIYHGPASNRDDCPRIYNASKINLNITSRQLLTALPLRVFDVLACGGFLLTDGREDTGRLFDPGRELAVYRDADDLLSKIRFYLERPDQRRRIGAAGRRRIMADYTFDHVVPEMLAATLAYDGPAANAAMPRQRRAHMQWCAALSFMKFGHYARACRLFTEVLRVLPDNHEVMFGMTALAVLSGQTATAQACIDTLAKWRSPRADAGAQLLAAGTQQHIDCWNTLYAARFPGAEIDLQPDGTVRGWQPRE